MKIDKINFSEEDTSEYGLKAINMDRLNQVVLVAGKNGSGKSRLLEIIKKMTDKYPNPVTFSKSNQEIKDLTDVIKNHINHIEHLEASKKVPSSKDRLDQIDNEIKNAQSNLKNWKEQISNIKKGLEIVNKIVFYPQKEDNHIVEFVPKSLELQDSYTVSSQQLDNYAKNIYTIGTGKIASGTIPAIAKIQRDWANANTLITDDLSITPEEKSKIDADYTKLRKYIRLFLNTDLRRTKEGYPELFDKRIGEANLSDGQKILLQFCLALFAQEVSLDKLIVFMDEPENHLHPAALIEVFDKITPHVKNGQIWIATHSINILAHFNPSDIWYIDNGEISYAGNIPHKVLEGLLGSEEEIEKLSHFLSLPFQIASNNFAFESLFYPKVLITGPEDPQVSQIHDIIKDKLTSGDKLKILDFGIGKARLLSTIFENERLRGINSSEWLDLYGYDSDPTNKDVCLNVFKEVYGTSDARYFNTNRELLARHDEKSIDFIVMCNVFHEIEPNEWINLFNSTTSPIKLLKEDGYLLIIEDQFIPVGEKAHSKGFLVFDELEFRKLFKITNADSYKSTDYRKDGRLKSHHIPKSCLNRIDSDSKKLSLETLYQNAKDEIRKLKKSEPSFKNGKLNGFWAQQLANASLALEEL